jgi:hypothetical protein
VKAVAAAIRAKAAAPKTGPEVLSEDVEPDSLEEPDGTLDSGSCPAEGSGAAGSAPNGMMSGVRVGAGAAF